MWSTSSPHASAYLQPHKTYDTHKRRIVWYGMPQVIQMTSKDRSSVEQRKGKTTINDASKSVMLFNHLAKLYAHKYAICL